VETRIPIFPLHTVLFPGQVLPLHIFESRYRQMVAECLRQSAPFGVVLIKKGRDVGPGAMPADVGTTARIAQVDTLADGRMNILAVGESRFVIHAVHTDKAYLEATATLAQWPDEQSADLRSLATQVITLLRVYLLDLSAGQGARTLDEMRDNPLLVATAAAAVPSIPLVERQRLLEMPTLKDVLQREVVLLEQERALLRALREATPRRPDPDSPFSPN
jgi:Lon protease-like protein